MIKKIAGSILGVAGFIICGWGLYLFGMSVYYLATKNQQMGPGAGIGYFYGIAAIIIGLALLATGGVILFSKEKFTKNQNIIISTVFILVVMFIGLDTKVLVLKEDDRTCQTYNATTFYGRPIGGQIAIYEKQSPNDKYAPRRMLSKSREGIAELRFVGPYKLLFIISTIFLGFALFAIDRRKTRK